MFFTHAPNELMNKPLEAVDQFSRPEGLRYV